LCVQETRDALLTEVFESEIKRNQESVAKELLYVDSFKIRMASNMVDVLYKVGTGECSCVPREV
jgi:hypothetical protein